MAVLRRVGTLFLVFTLGSFSQPLPASPQTAAAGVQPLPSARDGQHDFDFNLATWTTHIRYLHQPADRPTTEWVEPNGTVSVRSIWHGRAQMEEIEADGAVISKTSRCFSTTRKRISGVKRSPAAATGRWAGR